MYKRERYLREVRGVAQHTSMESQFNGIGWDGESGAEGTIGRNEP